MDIFFYVINGEVIEAASTTHAIDIASMMFPKIETVKRLYKVRTEISF